MKKLLAIILAAGLTMGSFAGCGPSAPTKPESVTPETKTEAAAPESTTPTETSATDDVSKTTGELTVWTNLGQEEMNFYVKQFNQYVPGVKVNVTVMPGKEYRTKLQNAFRTGTNAPDVVTMEISDLGMYKETDLLESLNGAPYNAGEILDNMIPYVSELSKNKNGDIKGLSWQSTPGGFWYKKALAREYLGTDDPIKIREMIKDWDTIVETGKMVYEKSGGKIALLDDIQSVEQIFSSYKGAPWVDDNGHIISDEFLTKEFELIKKVRDENVDAKTELWSAGWASGIFAEDMYILIGLPTWGLNYSIKSNIPAGKEADVADTWGYVEAPDAYQNGGTWYSVYSGSKNKDAAWAWVKTLTANEDYLVNGLVGELGDFPAYVPAIERSISEGHKDIVTGDQEYFQNFYDTAKQVKPDPMTKYDRQAWTSFGAQRDLVAVGQITVEEAVKGFKEDMKNIYPEIIID